MFNCFYYTNTLVQLYMSSDLLIMLIAYKLISMQRRINCYFYLFLKYNGLLFTFDPKLRPSKVYQSFDFDRLPIWIELSLIPFSLLYIVLVSWKRRKHESCELHHCYFPCRLKKSGPQKGVTLKKQTFVSQLLFERRLFKLDG